VQILLVCPLCLILNGSLLPVQILVCLARNILKALSARIVQFLKILLDFYEVIEFSLIFKLDQDRVILIVIVVSKVFHHEEHLTKLSIRLVARIIRGRELRV